MTVRQIFLVVLFVFFSCVAPDSSRPQQAVSSHGEQLPDMAARDNSAPSLPLDDNHAKAQQQPQVSSQRLDDKKLNMTGIGTVDGRHYTQPSDHIKIISNLELSLRDITERVGNRPLRSSFPSSSSKSSSPSLNHALYNVGRTAI